MRWKMAALCGLAASSCLAAGPALTIYNQQFAVVRETIPLNLQPGVNQVEFDGVTAMLEPDSVILRDPTGQRALRILEQNYRADPISLDALLRRNEGQTIDFQVRNGDGVEIVRGKIIRARGITTAPLYAQPGFLPVQPGGATQAIIEVDGKLRFDLPGVPLFPSLGSGAILKPVLTWTLQIDRGGPLNAELGYVSGGFNWSADYNVVQGGGDTLDLIGWVTMDNRSGKDFENAVVKLMAGDVNKLQPQMSVVQLGGVISGMGGAAPGAPPVEEKTFDEYHLYTLQRPVTLHDRETKQVEFVRATGVKSEVIYIYDGAKIDTNRYRGWNPDMIRNDMSYGTQSNPKVWVMREFANSQANHLGMPLPKGRVRFYRRDTDGQLEIHGRRFHRAHAERRENPRLHRVGLRPDRRAQADHFPDRHGPADAR